MSASTKFCGPRAPPTPFLSATAVAEWPTMPPVRTAGPSQGRPANSRTNSSRTKPLTSRIRTMGMCSVRLPAAEFWAGRRVGMRPDSEMSAWTGVQRHAHTLHPTLHAAPGSSDPPRGPRSWALSLLLRGHGTSAQGCNSAHCTSGRWVPPPSNIAWRRPGSLPQPPP